ncbi:MAG: hypothetical protein U1F77_09760 [Kiritimatiellia bacterium]
MQLDQPRLRRRRRRFAGTLALEASNALGTAGQIAVTGGRPCSAAGTTWTNPINLTSSLSSLMLAYWNFNALSIATASAPGSGGVPLSITANSGASTRFRVASWGGTVDDFTGSTTNALFSDPAEESLSLISAARPPATTRPSSSKSGLDFTGFTDARVTFAGRGTSTGFPTGQWAYSTDGSTFTISVPTRRPRPRRFP